MSEICFDPPGDFEAAMRARNHGLGRRRPVLRVAGVMVAIPLLAGSLRAQQTPAQIDGELPVKTVRQIEALLAAKAQRTPAQRKVSSQLLPARRAQVYGVASRAPDTTATDEMAMVDIQADVTPAVLARIRALGGTIINSVGRYRAIRANLPTAAVEQLAALEAVQSIRSADVAVTPGRAQGLRSNIRSDVATTRAVDTSEGDVAHQANVARQTYSVDGTGIGIGVISDGVDTLAGQQETGDVPARVTVLPGQAGGSISYACGGSSKGTEGTAMLEIVHDLAPGGELLFATGIGGAAQMAQNIEDLCAGGADIIVDDIGYLRASAFQDDVIAQAVSAAVGNGCYYFSAAGNGGNLNDGTAGVWEGDYAAGSPVTVNGVPVGVTHDFGGGEEENRIKRNSTNPISLQWSDPAGGSENDYDLFLIDADDNVLASSTNTQDGTQDPIEWIRGSCSDDREDTRLVIVKNTGAADRYLRLNYAREGLEIATAGHTFGHSASKDAVGVAAVDVTTAGGAGSVFNGTESVETFSSDGPRRIFFEADGTPITPGDFSSTGGRVLQKPDLAAADAVSTSTPGFSPFRGTSAAAPHAAAIAALMLEAAGGPDNVTLTALRAAMTGASIDIEATGVDRDSGAGLVMAPGAVDAVDVAVVDRNGVPTVSGTLDNRTMLRGADAVTVNVASEFSDPDNDTLTYNALSSDPDRVAVTRTGSQLTLTPGLPGLAVVTVRATDGGGLSVGLSFLVTVALGNRDYDVDDDGLIEVGNLAQLDAVRYDLNGDGVVDDASDWQSYYDAFDQSSLMGCPDGCTGYELTASLDFDTNNSGAVAPGDTYWNNGEGWTPIGGEDTSAIGRLLFLSNPFVAIFEGNGHTVSNLFIDTNNVVLVGLFGYASSSIRNMGVIDVDVKGAELAGGLIGFNAGEIRASYVTGRVTGRKNVGGLVGINQSNGEILASYSTSRVSGEDDVGGLVGDNRGKITAGYATGRVSGIDNVGGLVGFNQSTGEIHAGYATGRVSGDSDVGGLVGSNEGAITASYWDKHTSGHSAGSFGEGKTTVELQAPTGSSGIYRNWSLDLDGDSVNDWHFGTASQYPVLSVDTNGVGGATWQEFGYQLREGPPLTAAVHSGQVVLTWTPVDTGHWSPAPGVTYTLYREEGATLETLAEGAGGLQYTDTDVTVASTYTYQVAAVATGGEAARSAQVPVTVPVPISEIGLTASGGDRAVSLNWNRPTNDGGSPIIRYEHRHAPVGEVWNDWENVGARATGVTVGNLVNGLEYVFEVRAVNALGKGPVETAAAIPVLRTGPPPGGGGGGGGGPRITVPSAPTNLLADGGNEQVTLAWEAPKNDGGSAITDYEYRIDQTGEWISIGSTATTHTVTGLVNGTEYTFQVRAVTAAGSSAPSNRAKATPRAAVTLLVANFSNGNNGAFNSRVYLWNPSTSAGQVTVRVFTLPLTTGIARELTGPPLDLGTLEARSALNLKLVEDILIPLGIALPYTTDGGNLTLEFTIQAVDVRGAAQVFSSDFAFGTYPMQEIPSTSSGSPTVLVANFTNGNNGALHSRVYLWNPSATDGRVTVRVFTLPNTGDSMRLQTVPLGILKAFSARNIRIAEDILAFSGIALPYTDDGGNLMLEFTIEAPDVRGVAQVFSSNMAFGTYVLQEVPSTPNVEPTVLVAHSMNGNSAIFNSRVYLWNPSTSAGEVTVRVFTLPLADGTVQELTAEPLALDTLGSRSALNIKLAEDILTPLGIATPYTTDDGNLTLEFTIQAADVKGTAQVFSSDFASGTYTLQAVPSVPIPGPTQLVASFTNGNDTVFNSRISLFNPSPSAGDITVRVFTLPLGRGTAQELTPTPLELGTLEARSALDIRLAEDILVPLGVSLPYTTDGGNLVLELTIQATDVRGTAQVFSSRLSLGTYPLQ